MPVYLEAEGSFPYVLECDRDKPDPKPTFFLKVLNGRKRRELSALAERLQSVTTATEAIDVSEEIAKKIIVGWKDVGTVMFNQESIFDVIDVPESREMLFACLAGNQLSLADKKKLESQT